jgi:signal transduction histidine kinase
MMLVLEDVTERKQAADERARLKEAELALRERNQVLATVSHDLKAPLTIIKGQAQMLLRSQTPDPQRTTKGLLLIERAATRMTSWIDELLDTANLQAGRPLALQRAPSDLVALAWQAAAEHQRLTERHRIRVETKEREVVGLWDAARLARVLDNLLGNAIKYSPDGGPISVSVRLDEDADAAVLSVEDHGVGIPEADLPHIFERFRRGANVANRFAGSGIGLSGVSQIVRQHGGSVQVQSHPGQGTTFTVHLPLTDPD